MKGNPTDRRLGTEELPLVETLAEYEPEMADGRLRMPIRWALVNRTDEILSLSVHCAVEVQRSVDDSWAHVWGTRECLLGARRPFTLLPGERHQDLALPILDERWVSGRHRLLLREVHRVTIIEGETVRTRIPRPLRVSGPFDILLDGQL